jgi:hypothetical protein
MAQKDRFYSPQLSLRDCAAVGSRACKKPPLSFLSAFPMFVPSLSWQNEYVL